MTIAVKFMTEKKKKIVPPVTEDKPVKDALPDISDYKPPQVPEAEPVLESRQLVEKKLTQAERLEKIEAQLPQIENNFKQIAGYLDKMTPLLDLATQIQARQQQAQSNPAPMDAMPQKGGFDMASIFQMLAPLLGGGQSSSLDQEYINLAKESIKTDIDFTKSIKNALVSGIISKQTKNLMDNILP